MRQPVQFQPESEEQISHIAPTTVQTRPRVDEPRPRAVVAQAVRRNNSSAVRAILVAVLVILLAMLAYLMSLSSRPSVTGLTPKPGSVTAPGIVNIEAQVGAPKPIQQVTLSIDGTSRTPAVTILGDRSWVVRFQTVLPKGTHKAVVVVQDTNGNLQTQEWSFEAAGPRIAPTIAVTDPPSDAALPQGLLWIHATVQSDADIASATMTVNGLELPLVLKPADSTSTANAGDSTAQQWNVGAEHAFPAGSYVAHIVATDTQGDKSQAQWHFTVTNDPARASARYFSYTHLYISGQFLTFWETHNGSKLIGSPVSPEFTDQNGTVVQYFEYSRMEIGKNGTVNLGLVGDEAIASTQKRVEKPQNFDGLYFDATGHTLAGKFKDFWQANGGVAMFGYPISEVLDQNGTKVQYFERARFELAKDDSGTSMVRLTPLGEQLWASMQATNQP